LGDANDIYGGPDSNRTQTKDTTPEHVPGTLLPVGETYPFAGGVPAGTPCNLNADEFIKGHSDICKPEVFLRAERGHERKEVIAEKRKR
jgi:hypothetical protein